MNKNDRLQEMLRLLTSVSYGIGYFTAKRETCLAEEYDKLSETIEGYAIQRDILRAKILGYCEAKMEA